MANRRGNGLGIWFRDEIENALIAVDVANLDVAKHVDTPEMRLYRLGYEGAIQAVAAVFGIRYPAKTSETPGMTLVEQMLGQLPTPSQ